LGRATMGAGSRRDVVDGPASDHGSSSSSVGSWWTLRRGCVAGAGGAACALAADGAAKAASEVRKPESVADRVRLCVVMLPPARRGLQEQDRASRAEPGCTLSMAGDAPENP